MNSEKPREYRDGYIDAIFGMVYVLSGKKLSGRFTKKQLTCAFLGTVFKHTRNFKEAQLLYFDLEFVRKNFISIKNMQHYDDYMQGYILALNHLTSMDLSRKISTKHEKWQNFVYKLIFTNNNLMNNKHNIFEKYFYYIKFETFTGFIKLWQNLKQFYKLKVTIIKNVTPFSILEKIIFSGLGLV